MASTYGSPVQDGEYPNEMEATISNTIIPHGALGVKNQYTQEGTQVFTPQAGRTRFELPLDENRRVNFGFLPGSGLDGAPTAWDGLLPFDAGPAQENIKANTLPVEDPAAAVEGQKNSASAQAEAKYRAEKPQNVEYPTVPIINLSMQDVAALNNGTLPKAGNGLRKDAVGRAKQRLGLDENSAAYIPASNVMRNGEEYVLKITKASLSKMLSPADGGVVPTESIVVLDNIERIANNGVWFDGQGDRQGRAQILGVDHLKTTVYIDNIPYEVDMRVRLVQEKAGGTQDNVLYYFTPEEVVTVKK